MSQGETIGERVDLIDRIAELEAENARLIEKTCVPGVWRCPKCNYGLTQSTLHAGDGTVSARDDPGEKCPNCNCSLWRATYKDQWQEMFDRAYSEIVRSRQLETENARLRKIEVAARALDSHIRNAAYRGSAGLRLGLAVPVYEDFRAALTLQPGEPSGG